MNALHTQLTSAGIPVHGISIGRKDDKATWRVDFAPEATDEQKAQAAQIVAAFDVEKAEHNAGIDAQIAAIEAANLAPRFSREAILIGILKDHMRDFSVDAATALAQLTTVGGARYNAGFVRLKGLDDQIKALRAQRLP